MEEVFLLVNWGEDTTGEGFGLGSVGMSPERKLKSKCRVQLEGGSAGEGSTAEDRRRRIFIGE